MASLRKIFDFNSLDFWLRFPERVIFGCFFAHMAAYLVLTLMHPGFLELFTPEGKFSFKFLDPCMWLFWFLGFRVVFHAGFFEIIGWPSFFAGVGFLLHAGSIVVALMNGFLVGLTIMAITVNLTCACIIWGKLRMKHPLFE